MLTKKYLDELTYEIIGSAIEVHKVMGKGLLESVYNQCLKEELLHRKINFLTEISAASNLYETTVLPEGHLDKL